MQTSAGLFTINSNIRLMQPKCIQCGQINGNTLVDLCENEHNIHLGCLNDWLDSVLCMVCSGCLDRHNYLRKNYYPGTLSLKGMVLRIPQAVKAGSNLQIVCDYDLEGAQLYSIKFYQGEEEFYRFVPKESPPTRVFPRPGVQVDIFLSNSTVVTLRNVQKELTGFYGCEVSADAPLFHTDIKSAPVIVTEEPLTLPDLSVEKGKYSLGEKIRANCSSQGGYPPANLTWYINGKEVKEWVGTVVVEVPGMSEVEFEARSSLFRDGKLRLRCLATQFTLYRQSAEIDLQEDIPQLAHVMGPTPPAAHTSGEVNCALNLKSSLAPFIFLPAVNIVLLIEIIPR